MTNIKRPTDTVFFADSGAESRSTGAVGGPAVLTSVDPDDWSDYKGTSDIGYGNIFWRDKGTATWESGDAVSIPRHNQRINVAFGDGHVQSIKNSVLWTGNKRDEIAIWDNP